MQFASAGVALASCPPRHELTAAGARISGVPLLEPPPRSERAQHGEQLTIIKSKASNSIIARMLLHRLLPRPRLCATETARVPGHRHPPLLDEEIRPLSPRPTAARRRNPAPSPRPAEEKVGMRSPARHGLTRLAGRGGQNARSFAVHMPSSSTPPTRTTLIARSRARLARQRHEDMSDERLKNGRPATDISGVLAALRRARRRAKRIALVTGTCLIEFVYNRAPRWRLVLAKTSLVGSSTFQFDAIQQYQLDAGVSIARDKLRERGYRPQVFEDFDLWAPHRYIPAYLLFPSPKYDS